MSTKAGELQGPGGERLGALLVRSAGARIGSVKRQRRLRRLVVDAELIRRRAAGEPLRALARDYGVAHSTLSRYFARPELVQELQQARRQLRAERQAERGRRQELKREVLFRVNERAAFERAHPRRPAALARAAGRHTNRSDDLAAVAVSAGGGLQQLIEATGLHTLKNVLGLIDPAILKQALANDDRANRRGRA